MKKRTVALLLALVLCAGCAVGGTVAYLATKTTTITNTFTAGNINIELKETNTTDLKFIPGAEIPKDPTVTVKANSEACWLFVKVEEANNTSPKFIEYSIAAGWTELGDGVYYRKVDFKNADQEFPVLNGNKVTVPEGITKAQVDTIGDNKPTLAFTAYAVQQLGIDAVAAAWAEAQTLPNP